MLVACAAVSLFAPLAAQASDINIEGMNSYARRRKKSSTRFDSKSFINEVNDEIAVIDEQKVQPNYFEAGSFSETTTLDSSVVFAATAVDNATKVDSTADESLQAMYTFTMNLNTSFTGDDNLYT